jgi:hypothetical protein
MGLGFVVARFGFLMHEMGLDPAALNSSQGNGFCLPVGIVLMVAGAMMSFYAALRHRAYIRAVDQGQFRPAYTQVCFPDGRIPGRYWTGHNFLCGCAKNLKPRMGSRWQEKLWLLVLQIQLASMATGYGGSSKTVTEYAQSWARCPQRAANEVRQSQLWKLSGVLVSGHDGSLGTASPTL